MKHTVEQIKHILLTHQWQLSVAESLTGGLCQSTLVETSGISQIFKGGVICYTDDMKHQVLNISKKILETYTAVSQVTAESMVKGVAELFDSQIAIAFTGEAGPFIQTGKLGEVYIAIFIHKEIYTLSLCLSGERNSIRQQAVEKGLHFLLQCLHEYIK